MQGLIRKLASTMSDLGGFSKDLSKGVIGFDVPSPTHLQKLLPNPVLNL